MCILQAFADSVSILDRPRNIAGRFTTLDNAAFVTEVGLPNGLVGWQVGARGRIYASKTVAVKHAAKRAELNQRYDQLATEAADRVDYLSGALASEGC